MKFVITGQMTVSCWTEVEADTLEKALAIAKDRPVAEAHMDGGYPADECWNFDNDAEPERLVGGLA